MNDDYRNQDYDVNKFYTDNNNKKTYMEPSYEMYRKKKKSGFKSTLAVMLVAGISFGSLGFGIGMGSGFYNNNFNSPKAAVAGDISISGNDSGTSLLVKEMALTAEDKKIVDVIKETENAVVSINTETTVNNYFYGTITAPSAGSGVIFYEDADRIYIATNNHVIENAQTITVSIDDNNRVNAKVLGRDKQSDIAVLTVSKKEALAVPGFQYSVAVFGDDSEMEVGQTVIAIGNAAGEGKSATVGIVSAKNKTITTDDGNKLTVIQTDAAINPGNSGGPLVNMSGHVIGINTAKLSQANVEGMGYAIPSSDIKRVADEIVKNGTVDRPYLGIAGFEITDNMKEAYNLPSKGVYVQQVSAGSGAEAAGIVKGDIITQANGKNITTMPELQEIISKLASGEKISLSILRESGTITIEAEIKNANAV